MHCGDLYDYYGITIVITITTITITITTTITITITVGITINIIFTVTAGINITVAITITATNTLTTRILGCIRLLWAVGLQHFVLGVADRHGLDPGVKILPEYLKEAGYATHMVGKVSIKQRNVRFMDCFMTYHGVRFTLQWHLGYAKTEMTPSMTPYPCHKLFILILNNSEFVFGVGAIIAMGQLNTVAFAKQVFRSVR